MKSPILGIIGLFIAFCSHYSFATPEWIPLKNSHPSEVIPEFTYLANSLSIHIHMSGFYRNRDFAEVAYEISTLGAGLVLTPGEPRLPVFSYLLALPSDSISSVEINYISCSIFAHTPVRINAPGDSENMDSNDSHSISRNFLAEHIAVKHDANHIKIEIQKLGKIQNRPIVRISIFPFYANRENEELSVAENFTIHLHFSPNTSDSSRSLACQWSSMLDWKPQAPPAEDEIPPEYLIVTGDGFVDGLSDLIAWRTAEGMVVTVKTISQIKQEMQITELLCADRLRDYLSLYYNRQPNLTYVLLVGDVEFIPVKYENDEGTDIYYSLLDDTGDRLPDVYLGRLPVNDNMEVRSIVEKIITYEKMGASKRVLFSAYFQDAGLDGISDRDYIYTSELFRNYLIKRQYVCGRVYTKTPGSTPKYYSNLTPVPPDITFDGKKEDIIDFINIGAALVNHRDHGTADGWDNPPFRNEDISKLWNKRYPLMFNVDCSTGEFDRETENERRETEGTPVATDMECFSERLLTLSQRGVVAVIAPSRMTTNALNNAFNIGLVEAIWPLMFESCNSPATRLGQVLYRGRIKIVREFGGNGWVDEKIFSNFRCYHLLGDPALRIHQPQ